ncbi:glycosyltransferase family 2 protein [Cellulophaga sp. HaHaR_3_176]|uniref:glycosyltransferase family 2 protein n=1 Tax=Cellulophaga sp. HaHaR_3_176 TaxID=1942464 RepID=UPI001C1F2A21|nr:glycosyltransferase family 2 protein [Cellulophaga sp. HaHaR_3_176]QWX82711.1 glycosyltransferase family 2 protein [Cellulophaga sp. HaHaR_3_176]
MKSKLSVFIITYNEERIIEKCLKKLTWVDEVIVIDSGSTDATIEICQKYNVKLFHKDFEGFKAQKQFALKQTRNDWVLSLDAHEILSEGLISEIQDILSKTTNVDGYLLNSKHVFLGKIFEYGHESRQYYLRLFKKDKVAFDTKKGFENIIVKGNSIRLKNHFFHYSGSFIGDFLKKVDMSASIFAEEKYLEGEKFSIVSIFFKVKLQFLRKYFLHLNFMNGREGFYWSYIAAYYVGLKCIKANEQYKEVKKQLLF